MPLALSYTYSRVQNGTRSIARSYGDVDRWKMHVYFCSSAGKGRYFGERLYKGLKKKAQHFFHECVRLVKTSRKISSAWKWKFVADFQIHYYCSNVIQDINVET